MAALGVAPAEAAAVFHANRVVACTIAARAAGVGRGMRRREAQGRCPDLTIQERDHAREARTFEGVVRVLDDIAPRVELTRPGVCALATRGPSRYFGGDTALAHRVEHVVTEALAGLTTCWVGIADGHFAAIQAARSAAPEAQAARSAAPAIQAARSVGGVCVVEPGTSPAFLAPRSVTTLGRPELVDVLLRLGLTTLGHVAALSAADLLARFGAEGLVAHRLASGLDERPLATTPPPPELTVAAELDPPVERVDQAAFVARALATELHDRLAARGQACVRVAIEAETEHGEHLVRLWRHEGALSAAAIADRVRWQLDGWLDGPIRARPTGGLVRLALVPDDVVAAAGRQLGFWGGETAADERAQRAVVRLEAMLGPEAVRVPVEAGGRRADDGIRLVPSNGVDLVARSSSRSEVRGGEPVSGDGPRPWPGSLPTPSPASHGPALPVELIDRASSPIRVDGRGQISGEPARCRIDGGSWVEVVSWAGPWVIDERWWDPERHRRWARFQLVTEDGVARVIALSGGDTRIEATYD